MNPVYETMTKYKPNGRWMIRVWREEPEFKMGPDEEVLAKLVAARRSSYRGYQAKDFVDALEGVPRISAIEVLDIEKNGGLFYPDWS